MTTPAPTPAQFNAYQAAFAYFNEALFGNELPPVLLNFSRKSKTLGFFAPSRWAQVKGQGKSGTPVIEEGPAGSVHEISLNPEHLLGRPMRDSMSTLVHEMAHHWQQVHGKPGRGGYHNRQWAEKMRALGLEPVSYDKGAKNGTGQKVSHAIVEGGPFAVAFDAMPEAIRSLPYACRSEDNAKPKRTDKVKYLCPKCETKVWGKSGLRVICEDCDVEFEEQEQAA